MLVQTKAIVISSLRYGDTSLIVKCFTQTDGLKSYLLKGILKSKKAKIKAAYFQPLSILEIEASHKNKGTLENLRDVKVAIPYTSIFNDIKKSSILLFLAEMLHSAMQEEQSDPLLYDYLENSLIWLDTHDQTSNFHLLFLLDLTKYLGFYPDLDNADLPFFDLLEARFTAQNPFKHAIFDEDLNIFKRLLGTKFDSIHNIGFTADQRSRILNILIEYFQLHLQGFKKPKSLAVLNEVFR